jgi:hypothetical protein
MSGDAKETSVSADNADVPKRPTVRIVGVRFEGEGEALCPFCNRESEEMESIQTQDYVEWPMLWCDHCGARGVLDPASMRKFDAAQEQLKGDETCTVEIPLLFIERMSDYRMCDLASARALSPEEMVTLTKAYDSEERCFDPEVLKVLQCTPRPDGYHDDDEALKRTVMNVSVPVNSYNVIAPAVAHTADVHYDHDGVEVFLQVVDLAGARHMIKYWGD